MKRAPVGLVVSMVATLTASRALAAGTGADADTRVVARLDEPGHVLLYRSCHGGDSDPSCSLTTGAQRLAIEPTAGAVDAAHAIFTPVRVGTRTALHVTVPLAGVNPAERAWEVVLVPGASSLLAAGVTGWARGEPGERAGVRVVELPLEGGAGTSGPGGGTEIVVAEIHEDRRICGQAETLIQPRVLDPATLILRGATVPRLSAEARSHATPLSAEPVDPATLAMPLAPLLRATSTSGDGSAAALTDGDVATAWAEQRSGDGHGEFVTMSGSPELPITRLAFTLPTTPPTADATPPRTVHLATGVHLYEVTFDPSPTGTYVVTLPEPAATGCLSLVLDRAEGAKPRPVVTLAEIRAYGPFDGPGASVAAVATALEDDTRGDAAVQELARLEDAGVRAAGERLPALHEAGQRRALSVAESGTCEVAAPLFVAELGRTGVTPDLAERSERALRRCDRRAASPLVQALAARGASANIARVAAEVAPDDALPLLVHHLAVTAPHTPGESGFREALARAAERATADAVRRTLRQQGASLALVRALGKRAAEVGAEAAPIALGAAADPAPARRYLSVDPLVALAPSVPAVAAALMKLTRDEAWTVRLRVAERADDVPELLRWAADAANDPEPRVREAALGALARKKRAPPAALAHAGDGEIWTFVRLAAITAVEADPARGESDEVLARATTEDPSLEVRVAALDGIAARGGPPAEKLVRQLLDREDLSAEVRAGAARAAGALCLGDEADHLNELARPLLNIDASESARLVAVQALAALGRLNPKDLGRRVKPFAADGVPAEARLAARQALAPSGFPSPRCAK